MTIDLQPTNRGFLYGEFTDLYGQKCSIQKSSLAAVDALWLGTDVSIRMHLTQEMAAALIPLLQQFVKTGEL